MRKLRFIQKGVEERTSMYAPPMARPAEDWGGCATAHPYVSFRHLLLQPTTTNTDPHPHWAGAGKEQEGV